MRAPSLTVGLIMNLLFMQLLAIVIAWAGVTTMTVTGLAGALGWTLNDQSYFRIRDQVIASLARTREGSIRIDPNEELRDEIRRTPTLKFAVFETARKGALPGSSVELATVLGDMGRVETRGMDFFIADDASSRTPGTIWQWRTPFGPLFVAASGYNFRWADTFYPIRSQLESLFTYFLAAFSASAVVTWFAVRRGLAPLRRAAAAVDRIDLDTLGQRLLVAGVPAEVKPLIDSINEALARLDAGAARMRRYTANAAHELRTPVAILRARLENPAEPTFRTDLMCDARRLQAVVEQMVVSAQLQENQLSLDQEVNIIKAMRTIVGDCAPLALKAGRQIEFEATATDVFVHGNRQAIECIACNLINNAIRAEPFGGTVLVRIRADALIEVIDHGEGIAAADREVIFEPFWRKSSATPGTGLGLAIAKELMEKFHGHIWIEETPGGGSTFKLRFPRAS